MGFPRDRPFGNQLDEDEDERQGDHPPGNKINGKPDAKEIGIWLVKKKGKNPSSRRIKT
jgi:hypothetical protein